MRIVYDQDFLLWLPFSWHITLTLLQEYSIESTDRKPILAVNLIDRFVLDWIDLKKAQLTQNDQRYFKVGYLILLVGYLEIAGWSPGNNSSDGKAGIAFHGAFGLQQEEG